MGFRRVDSCHSTWLIDAERRRFCRLPRGSKVERASLESRWEPYYEFEVSAHDVAYVLALNETRTRLLRFWEHTDPCPHCEGEATAEVEVEPAAPETPQG